MRIFRISSSVQRRLDPTLREVSRRPAPAEINRRTRALESGR